MKVLVIPSWFPPNGGYFFHQQASVLARLGCTVKVIAPTAVSIRNPFEWIASVFCLIFIIFRVEQEKEFEVIRFRHPLIPRIESINIAIQAYGIKRVVGKLRKNFIPDVMHVHSLIWAGYAASLLKKKYGYPYFVTEHRGRFVNNSYVDPDQLKTIISYKAKISAQSAEKIYAVSSAMLPALRKFDDFGKIEFGVIPNMVDTEFFTPSTHSNKNVKFRFFSLAALIPLKGFLDLIDAFSLIKELDVELVIGGDGPQRKEIEARIGGLNLINKVSLLGVLDKIEVRNEMQKSDAFVLATKYEAFGVVFIEAMACGLPIITTNSGGPESIVKESIGYLSDVGDIQALALNMRKIINNRNLFDSVNIRNTTCASYSEDAVGRSLIQHFQKIIDSNNRSA